MNIIWASRGRTWGFRFLDNGNSGDPLTQYERAFAEVEGEREVCRRLGDTVVLRFPDPLNRKDRAGRVIPHDFVVYSPLAEQITSLETGMQLVWPLVAERFANIWDQAYPAE